MSAAGYHHLAGLEALNARLAAAEPSLLLALGDSNTCNSWYTKGAKQWPELLHERLKNHHGHQRLLMLNAGVSGDCVERVLARFESDVARARPEGVILCLGSNDAKRLGPERFRSGMEQLLDRIQALGSSLLLRTPTPILEYLDPGPHRLWPDDHQLQACCEVIRDLAQARRLPLVDTYALWRSAEQAGTLEPGELYCDAVHSNAAGHQLVCHGILPAFGVDSQSPDRATAADGSFSDSAATSS